MRAAEELIDCILERSRVPSARRGEIRRELRSHMDEFIVATREAGHGEDEVTRLLRSRFGDPAEIARGFTWVYRHERRVLRLLVYSLSTVLIAGLLLAAVLILQAGLAFGLGRPIMNVLASRHTVIEAFDVLASVAAYLGLTALEGVFETHRFQKATGVLTAILAILIVACRCAGMQDGFLFYGLINGVFFRALQLFVGPEIARTGIVLVCFALAGLVSASLRSPASQVALAATSASWLIMGAGYQLMTHLAARLDAVFLNSLQRMYARD